MNLRLRVATACSVILLAGVTSASDAPAPTMPGHAGDSWSYYIDMTITNLSNNVELALHDGILKRTILESNSPTRLVVQEETKDFTPPRGVSVIGSLSAQAMSASYFSDGTVDQIVEGANPAAYRLMNLSTIKFPSVGFKAGLNWSWKIDADSVKGTPPLLANYSVVEDGEYEGIPAWKISFINQELASNKQVVNLNPAQMEGYVWLRKTDLVEVSVSDEGTNLPVPGKTDLVRRTLSTSFIPELETHTPTVTAPPPVQGP